MNRDCLQHSVAQAECSRRSKNQLNLLNCFST